MLDLEEKAPGNTKLSGIPICVGSILCDELGFMEIQSFIEDYTRNCIVSDMNSIED